ncbi:MAG: hypothetical protein H0U05_04990 [Actinobacteria bacterium]|nr:hypothetical protein [Actinomycetota bacterium]
MEGRTPPTSKLAPEVLERVERAAATAIELHALVQDLKLTNEERTGVLGKLAAAFDYAESFPGEETKGVGTYFKPMMELGGRRYPPKLDEVPADVTSLWQAAADRIEAPLPRARLNDLCFEGGWGNRGERARAAANSYLDAADVLSSYSGEDRDVPVAAFARLRSLARVLALARTVADDQLAERAAAAIVAAAEQSLDLDTPCARRDVGADRAARPGPERLD